MALLAWCVAGCSTADVNPTTRFVFPDEQQGGEVEIYSSTLHPGDMIIVTFSDTERPLLPQSLNIPEGGIITLPYNVHVQASGKSTSQVEKEIRDAYVPSLFVNLTATIKIERRFFYVDGEVKLPGRQEYIGAMTVLRAVGTAGGFTDFAARKKIEVRRASGQRYRVNWYKAIDDPREDLPVYSGDHIIVKRSLGIL